MKKVTNEIKTPDRHINFQKNLNILLATGHLSNFFMDFNASEGVARQ